MPNSPWLPFAASARGSGHIRRGVPCEDAYATRANGYWSVLAIADGHGSMRCPRSARGARLAVDAAARTLSELAVGDDPGRLRADVSGLPARLVSMWCAAVCRAVLDAPLTPDEVDAIGADESNPHLVAHGCTLIAVAASAEWLVTTQIGDGEVLVSDAKAAEVRFAVELSTATPPETESLCQADAATRFRLAQLDLRVDPVTLVLAATDGFGGAFAEADWHQQTCRQVIGTIAGMDEAVTAQTLEHWCRPPAEIGGDDVTLGLLVHRRHLRQPQTARRR